MDGGPDFAPWTGVALAWVAVLLIVPGPRWVGSWSFLHRIPAAGLVLWQAGTVAALIATVAAGAVGARQLFWGGWNELGPGLVVVAVILLFAISVVVRLLWSLIRVARRTGVRRAEHRRTVDLVAEVRERGVRVLPHDHPVAYCLPGLRGSRVVLSQGALVELQPAELEAVLAHEQAHLRHRHDLVLDFFSALQSAFPMFVRSAEPLEQSRLLVEMLADDQAVRTVGPVPLGRALVRLADSVAPQAALGVGGPAVLVRIERLGGAPAPAWWTPAVLLLAAGLVVSPLAVLVLGWLAG